MRGDFLKNVFHGRQVLGFYAGKQSSSSLNDPRQTSIIENVGKEVIGNVGKEVMIDVIGLQP